jgi:hypothetical protein
MATPTRFERVASGLGILRSILLSYGVVDLHIAEAAKAANWVRIRRTSAKIAGFLP